MSNIILKKSYTECSGENSLRPFSKISKLSVTLDQQAKFLCSLIYYISKSRVIEIYWYKPIAFTSYKALLKKKRRSETSLLASFSACLMKKNVPRFILLTNQISLSDYLYFLKY